ncbi:hypothetical protein KPL70_015157 [Citrus sinensis]|nr:hypothetical protein KPL70_015157 [Citrus sinensis]
MKIRLLEERAKEIESKENELVLVEKKIKDCNFELACKEKELGLVRKRNGVCNSELQSKEDELNLVKNSAEKWPKRLNLKKEEQKRLESLDGLIKDRSEHIELKERQLRESEKELVLRKEQKASIRAMIEACTEKLEAIEESYDAAKAKLESEKKELELTQTFMKDLLVKRSLHEDNLQSLQSTIRLRENELECKEKELELKEREFCRIQERIEESSQELLLKENQLKSLISVGKSIVKWSEEIELKKKQLSKGQETNEQQLDLIQTLTTTYTIGHLEDRVEDLEIKDRQFEEHVREFELREREFDSLRKAVEDSSKNLELRQKKLSDILQLHRKKSAGPENLTSSGRNLQILLNQHLQRHDVIFCKVFETIRRAADPALLVLDAMSGFYPHSREGYVGFDVSIIRRTSPKINSQVQGEALKVAVEWKKNMEKDSLVVLGFLHLLAAYKLASAFDCNELASLLDIVANHRQTPKLRRSLGFADEVPKLTCYYYRRLDPQIPSSDILSESSPILSDCGKLKVELKEKETELKARECAGFQKRHEERCHELALKENRLKSVQASVEDFSKEFQVQEKMLISVGKSIKCSEDLESKKKELYFIKPEQEMEFDVSIVRRTCILLLEQLSDVASEINPLVRDEAMKVAGEWKEKMRAAVENSLEVLGLLHLLGAFRLAPAFDGNELESLLAIVAEDRQTPKLCRSLGFADKVPGKLSVIEIQMYWVQFVLFIK